MNYTVWISQSRKAVLSVIGEVVLRGFGELGTVRTESLL